MPISPSLGFARPGGAPIADLAAAFYGFAYGGLTLSAPIPVYAPDGCAQRLAGFFGRADVGFLSGVFDFRRLYDGHVVRHGELTLCAREVRHDVEAYGLRADAGGRVLAYSGDSGSCDALLHFAGGADLFLCEADVDAHCKGEVDPVHLTPEEAGAGARRAGGVGKLVITHVGPTLSVEDATARAASAFGGSTVAARVGETHLV